MAPLHRPIHPGHFHRIPAISHGSLPHGRSLLSAQGAVLRVDNCPSCLYTTWLLQYPPCYVVTLSGYLDDWLILAESRTTGIQERDRLLQVCEELGLQVNSRKSSLLSSQDMTYLRMQIQSVRFVAKPTETRLGTLLRIIEEFLSSPGPQQLSGVVFWASFRPLSFW